MTTIRHIQSILSNEDLSTNFQTKNNASKISSTNTMKSNFTITNSRIDAEIVDLEFLIDVNGNPEKIKVTNSTNTENNAKAIDLLKNRQTVIMAKSKK